LDGCGDSGSRKALLRLLREKLDNLPPFVHLFVTSRHQNDIAAAFKGQPNILKGQFKIDDDSNRRDIKLYLRQRLSDIRVMNNNLAIASEWPVEPTDLPDYLFGIRPLLCTSRTDLILRRHREYSYKETLGGNQNR
jgi:hypothetical protein